MLWDIKTTPGRLRMLVVGATGNAAAPFFADAIELLVPGVLIMVSTMILLAVHLVPPDSRIVTVLEAHAFVLASLACGVAAVMYALTWGEWSLTPYIAATQSVVALIMVVVLEGHLLDKWEARSLRTEARR